MTNWITAPGIFGRVKAIFAKIGIYLGLSISGGTSGRVLYDNAGVVGEYPITGTGNVMLSASPTVTGTLTGGMAAPRFNLKPAAAVSVEYLEALKVLSDETMSKACELLLSDRDYQPDGETTTTVTDQRSDLDQLHEIYSMCCKSAKIIEREAVATTLPSLPNASVPAARSAAVAAARGGPVVPKSKLSNRRMVRLPAPTKGTVHKNNTNMKRGQVLLLERDKSDSSIPSKKIPRAASPVAS